MKTIKIAAILLCAVMLSSCGLLGSEEAPNDKRLVSAIGFDSEGEEIAVSLEVIDTAQNTAEPYLLTARGPDPLSAILKIEAASPRELIFTHTAAVVLGEKLTPLQIDEIFRFCTDFNAATLTSNIVSAPSAEKLLSSDSGQALSLGYLLRDVLREREKKLGLGGKTSLYEIKTARLQEIVIYALPFFEGGETARFLGMAVYKKDEIADLLNDRDAFSYSVIRNVFSGGEVLISKGAIPVKKAKSRVSAELKEGMLYITLFLECDGPDKIAEQIKDSLASHDKDIFGIELIIKDEFPKLYRAIAKDYQEYYKDAEFRVEII